MNNMENIWTDEEIKRFWDFESRFKGHYFTYANGKQLINLFFKELEGKHIVDYGAGSGYFIESILKDKGRCIKSVSAVENSKESINVINRKFCNEPLFEKTYTVEDIKNSKTMFDTIFSFEVMEHLADTQLNVFFENMRLIMHQKTHLIITTPNDENIEFNYVCCPNCGKVFHRWQHVRSWNRESLCERLEREGFLINAIFSTEISKWTDEYLEAYGGTIDYQELESEEGSNLIAVVSLKDIGQR